MKSTTICVLILILLCFSSALAQVGPNDAKYFPHLVVGAGSNVKIAVQNLGNASGAISYSIRTSEGQQVGGGGGSLLDPQGTNVFDLEQIIGRHLDTSTLAVYSARITGQVPFGATAIQTLSVAGTELLPYGALPGEACTRIGLLINESENIRAGFAFYNPGTTETSCELNLATGSRGNPAGSSQFSLGGLERTSFFGDEMLGYETGFVGGMIAECTGAVVAYSLRQEVGTGNTTAVQVQCAEIE